MSDFNNSWLSNQIGSQESILFGMTITFNKKYNNFCYHERILAAALADTLEFINNLPELEVLRFSLEE